MIKAIAYDAFGTLIRYGGKRLNPYRLFLKGENSAISRQPFLTRNVPAATFATELGLQNIMNDFQRELTEELVGLQLFSEVENVLAHARHYSLQIAVCSNLAYEYGASVRRLLPGLDAYILSYEVGAMKPQPAIYTVLCEKLECRPSDVLFIGDSKRCDFDGPKAFGMQAYWLDRSSGQNLNDAFKVVETK